MTRPATRRRRWWKYLVIASGVGVIAVLAGLWYTTTNAFQEYVRRRMVEEVERITGGKAEVGSFHVVPFHLQVEVRNITVHGKEGPTDIPLAHADSLQAQVKVISFLRTEFGFQSLILEHPVVHIMIGPDGSTTNIPALRELPQTTGTARVEQLFALSIDRLSVHNGELLWADQKIPMDFAVHNANVQMDYSFLRGRYESHLMLGKVDTTLPDLRPFSWMTTIDFSLAPTFLDIKSLKWNSGKTSLEASGRITDFHNPRLDGTYEARINLEEAAAIARRRDLREGTAEFKGSGHWTMADFTTSGTVALRDLGWQDDQVAVRKAAASADYSVTDDQIKLSKLQGRLLGGSLTGEAQVDNWLHSVPLSAADKGKREERTVIAVARPAPKKGEKTKLPGVQSGSVRLRLRDISVGETTASLNTPAHPLVGFHPAGLASGSLEATWKGSPGNAEIAFNLDVVPAQRPAARELPVTAHIEGKYRGASDSLELAQLRLSTPASKVVAEGVLAASSKLHISVTTSDLEEWRPLVTAFGGPTDLPFRVNGSATFSGAAGGTFSSPTVAGTLVAEDFEFTVPATSRTPEKVVHWDSLGTSFLFSSHELALRGGTLRRGDTSADFEASATLLKGKLTENSPYSVRVNLHNVDVASTAALAGVDYPITGTADVTLLISGTRAHPQAGGHIHAVKASAYGEEIEKFDADLRVGASETDLVNIHLTHQDAEVTGSAGFIPANKGFELDLAGKNFDLSRVRQLHLDELPVDGRADFTLRGSGTLDAPVIDAGVHVRDLAVDHEPQGGFVLQGTTKGRELMVSGHSDFSHGTLAVDGTVAMHGDYAANITARMDHVDLDALWRAYLGNQLTGHSSVAATVTMQGPLRYRRQWILTGNLSDVTVDVEYAKLHNQDPVRFTYAQRTLRIDQTHMVGEGTDVTGHGAVYYDEDHRLDFSADGQLDLKLLGSLDPDLTASGQATVHLTVAGTVKDPLPQGTIQVKNAAANYAGLPSGVSEMNGTLTFTRDHIHIEQLTARTGGGTLDLKGDATNFNQQLSFNVTAVGKDVRLRYPPGVSSTATAELHWIGTRSSSTVSGDVLVTKLAVTPGFDFGSYLERSRQSSAITSANSPLYNIKLDVAVRTAPELQMKTAVARLSGDADLRLRGSAARPSVLGRADILEGDATFNGIKFRLERGDITFANPVAIEPQVNLQATTHVRNYDLDVTVTGTPDRLNVNYRSEPPLPKSDIIALLALGRTSEESEQLQQQSGQGMFNDEATNLIINQAINSTVSSRMEKLFGVSRIKIDPQGLTTETNPTARGPQITIEQEFANNLSLSYSTNVSQSSQQIIQGEYYINRNVSVLGTRDQNGVVSFDVRVRQRKK
ncbi:MAG TPA: translocation/assembly module TamB domain-containing protein [Candidatus Dormibacteraeota bacterium]|nr:translocation/assembly module TamB domain-containing protein [Candidatus Dormibacteraeota bacterium]